MRSREEQMKRQAELYPKAVRKRELHSSQEGTPMPTFGEAKGKNIPLHDYRGALGMAYIKKK